MPPELITTRTTPSVLLPFATAHLLTVILNSLTREVEGKAEEELEQETS
jgi:hypothetical protein